MANTTNTYDPGPRVAQCGSINLGTRDIERSLTFFRDALGMEEVFRDGNVSYLRGYQELTHHSLVLTEQSENLVNAYSFRVARPQDIELFAEQFRAQGIEVVELAAGVEAGRGEAIRFLLPGGQHPFELYYQIERPLAPEAIRSRLPTNSARRRGLGVRRLDHFNIQTSPDTINQAELWIRENLGLNRREFAFIPDRRDTILASWMSVTSQMHDVAIGASRSNKQAQLHHVAFNLQDFSDILTAADVIRDLDVPYGVGPGKHGIGQAMYLYIHDPGSDHRIELYAGGYSIFEPDWTPVEWSPENVPEGMTWYGEPLDFSPGSKWRQTSGATGLDWRAI